MAPNNDIQYKMNPMRMHNLIDQAAAQRHKVATTLSKDDFSTPLPSRNRRTRTRGIKPRTKPSIFFTYTRNKPKTNKEKILLSGEMQYHIIAKRGTRKDKRKAVEVTQKVAERYEKRSWGA